MDLRLDPSVAIGYKNKSQVARRISEEWAARNLYCLVCTSAKVNLERTNTPVRDYRCPGCGASYQLKSKKGLFGAAVSNSAYGPKMAAISHGTAPHYVFLQYSSAIWRVTDLFALPGHLLNAGVVQRRNPLKSDAKRPGWVGSNILLGRVPMDVRVPIVATGAVRSPAEVRRDWARYSFLQADRRSRGGWGADVLLCIRTLQRETGSSGFTLQEFYWRFANELASRYPENRHVEAKIRQQLQALRDGGLLAFLGQGHYRVIV